MVKILLVAFGLILTSIPAAAEPKLTVRVSLEGGPTITVSNASEEDLKSGKVKDLLTEAAKQAREAWFCLAKRRC